MKRAFAVLALLTATRTAVADDYKPKKDRERATKSDSQAKPPAVGTKPAKLLNVYNQWTKDWLAIDPSQLPDPTQIDVLLRDHFTNKLTQMDKRLVEVLIAAAKQFKADAITIVSGFRHPKYNLMLRKKGHQVARDSQHTHGNAVDFTIAKVPVKKLHEWAKAQKLGGVGIYPRSGFIHMDTGPIRFWSGE